MNIYRISKYIVHYSNSNNEKLSEQKYGTSMLVKASKIIFTVDFCRFSCWTIYNSNMFYTTNRATKFCFESISESFWSKIGKAQFPRAFLSISIMTL